MIHEGTFVRKLQTPDSSSALRDKYEANVLACLHILLHVFACTASRSRINLPPFVLRLVCNSQPVGQGKAGTHNVIICTGCCDCPGPAPTADTPLYSVPVTEKTTVCADCTDDITIMSSMV